MTTTRRSFLGQAAAGAACALGALAFARPLSAAPLAKVKENGALRVGLYADNRPWSWDAGGVPAGIDVDLAKAIAKELGVRADIALFLADEDISGDLRNVVWRGGLLGFQRCDLMLHVPFDRELSVKEDNVVFVAPYYREEFTALCTGRTKDCEMPPQRFVGSKVAAELDSIPDFYLVGSFGGILRGDVDHYPSGYAAAEAVHAGDAEMAVATRAQIEASLADHPDSRAKLRKNALPMLPSKGWDIGMAVREDSRTLGFAIEDVVNAMAADGRMAAIFANHGVTWQGAEAARALG